MESVLGGAALSAALKTVFLPRLSAAEVRQGLIFIAPTLAGRVWSVTLFLKRHANAVRVDHSELFVPQGFVCSSR